MPVSLNKVFIIGRLTRDPEGRTTAGGQKVASVSVATNRTYKDKDGNRQDQTEFHNIVVWGRLAEITTQYLIKGQEAMFEGRLQTRSWDGQDGVKRYKTEIVAESMQMGAKPAGARQGEGFVPTGGNVPQKKEEVSAKPAPAPVDTNENVEEIKIEDIPF